MAVPRIFGNRVVLWRELVWAARSARLYVPRYAAAVVVFAICVLARPNPLPFTGMSFNGKNWEPDLRYMRQAIAAENAAQAYQALSTCLEWQLILLILVTPAVTAGALGHEKEQDTLVALLGTQLRSRDIVFDKLVARLLVIAQPICAVAPLFLLATWFGNVPMDRFGLAAAQVAVVTFGLASVCLLSSVWTRRTSDALLGCYSAMIIMALLEIVLASGLPWPDWLNPFAMLREILTASKPARMKYVFIHLVAHAVIGAICLALSIFRLRPAALAQAEQRPGRWLWAFRLPITNNPVRWRERHVFGVAALPILRTIPKSLALTGTFAFSAIIAGTGVDQAIARNFFSFLFAGEFRLAYFDLAKAKTESVFNELIILGLALCVIGGIVGVVRMATSISEEKRRKTWDDLAITPLSHQEIVSGKRLGIIDAALPHVLVYSIPMFALGGIAGPHGLILAAVWLIVAFIVIGVALGIGSWVHQSEPPAVRRRQPPLPQPIKPKSTLRWED
jgi:ABC-type Na+ efflux pump permease subunit